MDSRRSSTEEDADENVFEIIDFTQASPWERFIAQIEDLIRAWDISAPSPSSSAAVPVAPWSPSTATALGGGDDDGGLVGAVRARSFQVAQSRDALRPDAAELALAAASLAVSPPVLLSGSAARQVSELVALGGESFNLTYHFVDPQRAEEEELEFAEIRDEMRRRSLAAHAALLRPTVAGSKGSPLGASELAAGSSVAENTELPPFLAEYCNPLNDFRRNGHALHRQLGCRAFLMLTPVGDDPVRPEKAKLLLSSLILATSSSSCSIPLVVPVGSQWRNTFLAAAGADAVELRFELNHHASAPRKLSHIEGIVDWFQSRVPRRHLSAAQRGGHGPRSGSTQSAPSTARSGFKQPSPTTSLDWDGSDSERKNQVMISAKWTFALESWMAPSDWRQGADFSGDFGGTESSDDARDVEEPSAESAQRQIRYGRFMWGPALDPIEAMNLGCIFLSQEAAQAVALQGRASGIHAIPSQADLWTLGRRLVPDFDCPTTDAVVALAVAAVNVKLDASEAPEDGVQSAFALGRKLHREMTRSLQSSSEDGASPESQSRGAHASAVPLMSSRSADTLNAVRRAVFGEDDEHVRGVARTRSFEQATGNISDGKPSGSTVSLPSSEDLSNQTKAAPPSSPAWPFALLAAEEASRNADVSRSLLLIAWADCVREARRRWELRQRLPGSGKPPHLGHCLLAQKWDMIAYCSERKRKERPQKGDGWEMDVRLIPLFCHLFASSRNNTS
jgi:hypothetical protein